MRTTVLALFLAFALPAGAAAQTTLSARPVTDTLLVWLLNNAVEVPIHNLDESPFLYPRLYAVPEEGSCVEDTHAVCTHHYFLAVSEDGELPGQSVFALGEVGEILQARVQADRGLDARLVVTVLNYASTAFQYEDDLVREEYLYSIALDLHDLRISAVP